MLLLISMKQVTAVTWALTSNLLAFIRFASLLRFCLATLLFAGEIFLQMKTILEIMF